MQDTDTPHHNKVSLRRVTRDDKKRIRLWRNDLEVSRYMYNDSPISEAEHARWFANVLEDNHLSYWIIVANECEVGVACLYDIDRVHRRAQWAFYLGEPTLRGQGIGAYVEFFIVSYAFEVLKLNKLCCEVFTWNKSIVKMHKNFGFVQEGYLENHIYKGGEFHDVVCFGLLKEAWPIIKVSNAARLAKAGFLIPIHTDMIDA